MYFSYDGKRYEVNVDETLSKAQIPGDYYPDIDEDGIAIREFDGKDDFSDCEAVLLVYNYFKRKVYVHLCREDYKFLPVEITSEEMEAVCDYFE